MQFMNSSVDKLVRNLTKNDFKSLTEEFGFKNLKRLKKRMFILMSTWTVLKDLVKKKLPDEECFYSSVKDGTTGDNGEKLVT